MTGVTIFRGPAHVIEFQSDLFIAIDGVLSGLPAREAFIDCDGFGRFLSLLDLVYETGDDMRADMGNGVLWFSRLDDHSGVGVYYSRQLGAPLPCPPQASPLYVRAFAESPIRLREPE